jgi:succinate dehydrogenase / fumarate reductase cytochrome b subunit
MVGAARPDVRPIAPHLQVWRWHVTMFNSIVHRATGTALYGAMIALALWVMAAAAGGDCYAVAEAILASPVGQILLYLSVAALAFHLANGIRHLVFDTGAGLEPASAGFTAWLAILFAIAAPIGLWFTLSFGG